MWAEIVAEKRKQGFEEVHIPTYTYLHTAISGKKLSSEIIIFFGKKKTFKFSQLFNNYNNNSNISLASQKALMTLRSPWKT